MTREVEVSWLWFDCAQTIERHNFVRHIQEVHLGYKRVTNVTISWSRDTRGTIVIRCRRVYQVTELYLASPALHGRRHLSEANKYRALLYYIDTDHNIWWLWTPWVQNS